MLISRYKVKIKEEMYKSSINTLIITLTGWIFIMRITIHISTSSQMFFIISNKKNTTTTGQFQNTIGKS
jgi:hypothetical protein